MPQADEARKAITKIPVRQSKRLRGYNMMISLADRTRAKDTSIWLHSIHGDVATGMEKAKARVALGYGSEGAEDDEEPMDLSAMEGGMSARFIGREHLAVTVTIEEPVRRGMPMTYLDSLSDIEFTATGQVAKDLAVVTRWEVNGKHTGELLGVPPSGRHVTLTGMTMVKFDEEIRTDGQGRASRALEEWTYWDLPSLAEQIGAKP
jgi:predicted ester cyclase